MAFRRSQRSGAGSQRMRASGGIAISRSQSSDGFGSDSGPSRGDSVGSLSARRRHPPPRSARSASRRLQRAAMRKYRSFRDSVSDRSTRPKPANVDAARNLTNSAYLKAIQKLRLFHRELLLGQNVFLAQLREALNRRLYDVLSPE